MNSRKKNFKKYHWNSNTSLLARNYRFTVTYNDYLLWWKRDISFIMLNSKYRVTADLYAILGNIEDDIVLISWNTLYHVIYALVCT